MTRKYTKAKTSKKARSGAEVLRKALHARKGGWAVLCSSGRINYQWLRSFAHGRIKDPSHSKLVELAEALGMEFPDPYPIKTPENKSQHDLNQPLDT